MNQSLDRRQFLHASGRLTAGLAAVSVLAGKSAASAQPQNQNLCLSCRDAHLKQTGRPDCWSALQSIGADGVEVAVGDDLSLAGLFHPDRKYTAASQVGIDLVLADAKAAGKQVSALCMFNRFAQRPDFEVEQARKVAQAAKALGAKAIRIDLAAPKKAPDDFLDFSVKTLKRLIEATEATGVAFGIENHGATTNNPEFLKPLFERVGSPRLGLTLDTGNFYWFGHPLSKLYELYEMFAPRVFHTHCKSIRYPESEREKRRAMGWEYGKYNRPIYEGDIDFRRVVKILRAAGYSGDLCIEDESLDKFPAPERGAILTKEIRHLKECMA
jgi:sugar phosphate isomerase/epimerase